MSPEIAVHDGRALGAGMRLVVTRPERLDAALLAVQTVLEEVDRTYSRFRADSELTALNANPGAEQTVSPLLAQALSAALRGAQLSGGAVDPTVGRALRLAGYDTTFAAVAPDGPGLVLRAHSVPGWQAIIFDARRRAVRLPAGVELDLGATGKGLAADLASLAALAALEGRGGALVSLGGDIAVAGVPPEGGWIVQVGEDSGAPISPDEEVISISGGALATSSTTVRRWTRGEITLHHILDPATGLPVQGPWRTASVIAQSCVDANIASTAAIVKGSTALTWLEAIRLPARLVDSAGAITRLGGWPEPGRDARR
jgi:thiamine biosynthesis lipoprotein